LNVVDNIRLMALEKTVDYLYENSPYYQRIINSRKIKICSLDNLSLFPIITREEVTTNLAELRCKRSFPELVQYTTGTTGQPLPVYRTMNELLTIKEIVESVVPDSKALGLTLRLVGPQHGIQGSAIEGSPTFYVDVSHRNGLEYAKELLTAEHRYEDIVGYIEILIGSLNDIKRLTIHLLSKGVSPENHKVRWLGVSASYLTQYWRHLLTDFWRAKILNTYGVTEITGRAHECFICGRFHFDPYVIPELVNINLEKNQYVENGIGRLLLSSLYPFSADLLLLRYDTGDLFELYPTECSTGIPGFSFLGRAKHCLLLTNNEGCHCILTVAQIREFVDGLPDIALETRGYRVEHLPEQSLGRPCFSLNLEKGKDRVKAVVELGLRYPPYLYPKRIEEITKCMKKHLMEQNATLKEMVMIKECDLEIRFFGSDKVLPGVDL